MRGSGTHREAERPDHHTRATVSKPCVGHAYRTPSIQRRQGHLLGTLDSGCRRARRKAAKRWIAWDGAKRNRAGSKDDVGGRVRRREDGTARRARRWSDRADLAAIGWVAGRIAQRLRVDRVVEQRHIYQQDAEDRKSAQYIQDLDALVRLDRRGNWLYTGFIIASATWRARARADARRSAGGQQYPHDGRNSSHASIRLWCTFPASWLLFPLRAADDLYW